MIHRLSPRLRSRFHHTWIVSMLALLGIFGSLVPATSAQVLGESATANQFFSAVNQDTSMNQLSAGNVLHTPLGTFVGTGAPGEFGRELRKSFSHIEFSTNSTESFEQLQIVRFTMTAVHTGDWHGLVANCMGITVPGVAILRYETHLVTTEHPDSGTLGSYLDPIVEARSSIVEQWIGYDEKAIANQISAYRAIPSYALPNCFDTESDGAVVTGQTPDPSLPPATDEPVQWENPY